MSFLSTFMIMFLSSFTETIVLQIRTCLMFWSARGVMSSPNSCVVVCVNVLGWGQVDVRSTQNSCVVVFVNVLGWGQMEVSRGGNIGCFSWLSSILSISCPTRKFDKSEGMKQMHATEEAEYQITIETTQ